MIFEYLQRITVDGQIDIEDLGECVLRGRNDLGEEFYLITHSDMGWTEVVEYGPAAPLVSILPFAVNLKYQRFEFSQGKIERMIDKFLNDPKRMITQADVVSLAEVRGNVINPLDIVFPLED